MDDLDAVRSINDCCCEKNKQPYLLFCSNYITKAKGIVTAVKAFGLSGLTKEGIRLKVVGNCWDGLVNTMRLLAEEYECEDSVDFIPFQSDVKVLFANAKAFIQPSANEGLGRTTVEAMFFGCPVIACASGGSLEVVKDCENGYLFNTEEECAQLMRKICYDNQEQIVLRALDFAKAYFSVEGYGDRIMEVYNSVLK